ncbi:MAG: diaminobutyrate acetyltransferase [Desulforegulaceae bacterium]|jgi:L-2,4-diaminobutyric acid acetyltransferase|nr:diaminobutyrate acetyltransferase [Desulforegulaceae bacterium]
MVVMTKDSTFNLKKPVPSDGKSMWELVKNSKSLDLNSLYHYILMAHHFGDSSIAAFSNNELAGFVTAYFPPVNKETLFVWQVCVSEKFQGKGLGKTMLTGLVRSELSQKIKYLDATITPSNKASIALFTSTAKALDCNYTFDEIIYPETFFGKSGHEPEKLFHIGPIL